MTDVPVPKKCVSIKTFTSDKDSVSFADYLLTCFVLKKGFECDLTLNRLISYG